VSLSLIGFAYFWIEFGRSSGGEEGIGACKWEPDQLKNALKTRTCPTPIERQPPIKFFSILQKILQNSPSTHFGLNTGSNHLAPAV
jgi:hypothetical protein